MSVVLMHYYDHILAAMFCSLALGAGIGALTAVPLNVSASTGAVLAAGFMYHGMFQRAPGL